MLAFLNRIFCASPDGRLFSAPHRSVVVIFFFPLAQQIKPSGSHARATTEGALHLKFSPFQKKKKNRKKEKKSETKSRGKKKRKTGRKGDRWVSKALVALLGWKRMPLIMRCLFYPPALCLSRCYACFPLAPIISALEPGDNNEFTEIEKCLGLNCMYLVTQTEAMAWERLVSQWHHLATQPL